MKVFETYAIKGEGRGERIGLPTINLSFKNFKVGYGVYLVKAEVGGKKYSGLLHYGPKKTFSDEISLELFLKERIENIFEKKISLYFFKKIRDIKKFSDSDSLKEQINKDLENLK